MRVSSWRRTGTLGTALLIVVAVTRPLSAPTGSVQGRVADENGTVIVGATVTVD